MPDYIVILTTILLFFTSRIFIIKYFNFDSTKSSGDCIGHLHLIKNLIKNNGKIRKLEQYIFDTNDYPNGFHKLFFYLKIPLSQIERYGCYIPSLSDFLLLVVIFFSTSFYGGDNLLYLLYFPFLLIFIHNEGRTFYLSERSYGALFGTLYLFFIGLLTLEFSLLYLFLSFLCFVIISVSSKFSLQAIVFISFIFTILSLDYLPLFYLFVFFISAHSFTNGYSTFVVRGSIRHSKYVFSRISKHKFNKSSIGPLFNHKNYLKIRSIFELYFYNPLFLIFFGFGLSPLFFYHYNPLIIYNENLPWYVLMTYSGFIVSIIISFKKLKFLGEPERYLEYIILPLILSLSFVPINFIYIDIFVVFLILLMFILKMYQLFILYHKLDINSENDQLDFISFTSTLDVSVVLCIDLRLSFLVGYYNEKLKFVNLIGNIGEGFESSYDELVPDLHSYPGSDLAYYVDKYSLNYICVNKRKLKLKNPITYDFSNYNLIFNNNTYSVYSV
jgi:hypothetical protein